MRFRSLGLTTIGVATLMFGLAIAIRDQLNPWLSNLAAGGVSIGLAIVILRSQLRRLFAFHWLSLLGAAVLGVAMVALTHGGYRLAVLIAPEIEVIVTQLYRDIQQTAPPLPLMIPLIAFIVLAEELVWRGIGFGLFENQFATGHLVLATTMLYAAPQLIGGSWLLIAAAISVGAVFGLQRAMTDRLSESLLTHAIWSISIFGLIPLR